MTNRINNWIKIRIVELRETLGGKCIICGSFEKLEFAHIKETGLRGMGRGRKERYYDVIKNITSYELMCTNCHTDFDNGLIDIEGNRIE